MVVRGWLEGGGYVPRSREAKYCITSLGIGAAPVRVNAPVRQMRPLSRPRDEGEGERSLGRWGMGAAPVRQMRALSRPRAALILERMSFLAMRYLPY